MKTATSFITGEKYFLQHSLVPIYPPNVRVDICVERVIRRVLSLYSVHVPNGTMIQYWHYIK